MPAGGDACIFVSAFFFSLATVRLSKLAMAFPTLRLAAAKSVVMAIIAAGWLGTSALGQVQSLILRSMPDSGEAAMVLSITSGWL